MRVIDGKYRIVEPLGEGFGGSVYLVESGEERLALKQLRMRVDHECLSGEEILENFKQEFSTLKKLNHPNILRILDFGFASKQKFYYFTTEYVEGTDIFQATRGLQPEEIEELFVQALRALGYLHSQGIYHFDIKPTNIMVGVDPSGKKSVKLIDFGLAAFQKRGMLAGSPAYLAPEALLEEGRDGRADLYSLGITWYTCLAGANPFDTGDLRKTVDLQRVWNPPKISTQSTQIPPYLDPILDKLLQKNPTARYHRAHQIIRDLNWSGRRRYPLETEATALAYLPGEGRLVGREKEWSHLVTIFNRIFLTQSESKSCVFITGPAGSGKSRLIKELKYQAQLQTVPVLNLLETPLLKLNADSLLIAEDVDSDIFKWIESWMHQFSTHSFLILLTGKTATDVPEFGVQINLENFSQENVKEYTASVSGMDDVPDYLVDELFRRTEGNPLLLTQLLHSLIQSHQIFDEQGRWSPTILKEVGIDFGKLEIPKTLLEFCRNKYQKLEPAFQRLLSICAIAKAPLRIGHIHQLGLAIEPFDWKRLEKDNLVATDPTDGAIRLLNPVYSDFIPQILPAETIADLHQSLGELFHREPDSLEAAWYHLGRGNGDHETRFVHMERYGESLLDRGIWLEAAHCLQLAADIAPNSAQRVAVILKKSRAWFRTGHTGEALKLLEDTQAIMKKERDNPLNWRWVQQTYREMANIYLKADKLDLARESVLASRVLLEEHEDNPVEEMILDNFKASLLMREGKINEAEALSGQSHGNWRKFPLEQRKLVLNNELASIYLARGKTQEAKQLFQEHEAFFQEIGHRSKQAYALYGWAESCYAQMEYQEATRIYLRCADLSREIKNEELLFHTFNGLGNIAYFDKNWESAAKYYQEALDLAQHHASLDSTVAIAGNLALVLRLQGDYGSAQLYLQHVINSLEPLVPPTLHQLQFLAHGYCELGKLKLAINHFVEARDAFRDAARLVRIHPTLEKFRFQAVFGLAETAINLERFSEAQTALTELEKENLGAEERRELEMLKQKLSPKATGGHSQKIHRL